MPGVWYALVTLLLLRWLSSYVFLPSRMSDEHLTMEEPLLEFQVRSCTTS